jgi:uroporphyrinogen III methyltransferase / synthase
MAERAGKVFLVGAGPGAADLITLRARECLARANVVIYDYLVNPELLRLAPPRAELIYAGKRGGGERSIEQDELNRMLIEQARAGRTVARLKGGDPFIFGRGGEEAEALGRAGITYEVVPGVTSAIAAPAFAGIPLTHRERGSFVAFVTGHEDESRTQDPAVPWDALARAASEGRGTIVMLMASARLRPTLTRLVGGGLAAATPAAAIQWATTASQKTVRATVATLADQCERAGLGAPAVVVVGECAALADRLAWFERMPLFGRRIVVTRAERGASSFARELRSLGADAVEFPTIETAPPSSYEQLDRAIGRAADFDWMVFTSATGVECFIERLRTLGRDIRSLGRARVAAIGPATAARLRDFALAVDALPAEYRAEAIVPALGDKRIRGARFLIPRAEVAREELPEMLRAHGAAEVVVAPAYRTIRPQGAAPSRMREMLAGVTIDLVAFTSSSTVRNFTAIMGDAAKGLRAAAIGPITAETAREAGFDVVVSPAQYTIAALVEAIRAYFAPLAGSS